MTAWPVLLMLLATAMPPVEVATLNGEQRTGTLERLTAEEAVLKGATGLDRVPASDLLKIRVPGAAVPAPAESAFEVRLTDNSLLRVTAFTSTTSEARVTHPLLGSIKVPLAVVHSVRLAPQDAKVDAEWKQLLSRTSTKDQVAIRKNDVLDHLDGVVGSIDDATVKFQLDGEDIPVKRERVFGLIYSKREINTARTTATIDLTTADKLSARVVTWEEDTWKIKLASGIDVSAPTSSVQVVDYSLGKIAYLSDLKPRDVKYTPFFDLIWEYRRDRSLDGRPLSVGNKTYSKGLALHSLTVLKYRIGGDYRRFQTVIGIDDDIRAGNVDVTIKGDSRVLFKGSARAGQPPQPLDLDVTGIVELEITVGYGDDELDIGDRLNMADARLLK